MKKKTKQIFVLLLACMVMFSSINTMPVIAAQNQKNVKKVSISSKKITLNKKKSKTLKMKNVKSKVKWSTTNKKMVSIKPSGKYKAKCKITAKSAGTAYVKAKVGKKTYKCKVVVKGKNQKTNINNSQDPVKPSKAPDNIPSKTPSDDSNKNKDDDIIQIPDITPTPNPEPHKHNFKIVSSVSANCIEDGQNIYKCDCGEEKLENLPAIGHDYEKIITPATCTEYGQEKNICKKCKTETVTKLDPIGHTYGPVQEVKPQTCLQDGVYSKTCTVCGYSDIQILKTEGHDLKEEFLPATCMENGKKTITCNKCDYKQEIIIPAAGKHEYNEGVVTKEATSDEEGTKTFTCKNCGQSYTEVIPAIGHHYDTGTILKEATCTEDGKIFYSCTDEGCNKAYTKILPKLGHDFGEEYVIDKEATCEEDGSKSKHCSRCDEKSEITVIPKGQHIYGDPVVSKATCLQEGEKVYTCNICKKTYTEVIPATGHTKSKDYIIDKEATCSQEGSKHNYCTVCKETLDFEIIPMTAHINKVDDGTAPTCTKTGLTDGAHCIVCNKIIKEQTVIPALGHKESTDTKVEKEATCTEDGKEYTYCTVCGEKITETTIPATKHECDKDGKCKICKQDIYPDAVYKFEAGNNMIGIIQPDDDKKLYNVTLLAIGENATIGQTGFERGLRQYHTNIKTITIIPYQEEKIKVIEASYLFSNFNNLISINGLSNFNTSEVTSMVGMFNNCSSLKSLDLSNFNTSKVTSMHHMFGGCSSLKSLDLSNFNTSKVTSMTEMFYSCSSLKSLDLSNFNTSEVTDMTRMFFICSSLESLDLSNFDTSKVTNMSEMFDGCSLKSLDLSNFDTSKVTSMHHMFTGCSSLESLDLSNFNTSEVTSMVGMFNNCSSLKSLDLSNFDTSEVTDMTEMLDNCSSLESLDLSSFNTSKVTNMSYMFRKCSSLKSLDLSNFNTSKVIGMYSTFDGCSSLKSLDLSNFDTSKVTDMSFMFYKCSSLESLNLLNNFNTDEVTSMYHMFTGCSSLKSLDLSNFNTSKVKSMVGMFYDCSSLEHVYVSYRAWNKNNIVNENSLFKNSKINHVTYLYKIKKENGNFEKEYRTDIGSPAYFSSERGSGFPVFIVSNISSITGNEANPDKYTVEMTANKYGYDKTDGIIMRVYKYNSTKSNYKGDLVGDTKFFKYSEIDDLLRDEVQLAYYTDLYKYSVNEAEEAVKKHKPLNKADWFYLNANVTDIKNSSIHYGTDHTFISWNIVWAMLYNYGIKDITAVTNYSYSYAIQ